MGGLKLFSIETSLEQHKEDTAKQIQLVSDSVRVVDQKIDFIIEELRQMRLGLVEKAFQQHKEETVSQIQSLKESIQALQQKTYLILEELRQLHECPKELMGPVEATHTTTTTTNAVAAAATLTSNESSNSVVAELTLEGIKQFYVDVDREQWKEATLCDLQKNFLIGKNVVVFVNTQDKAKWLIDVLRNQYHIPDLTLYGDMEQHVREYIMRKFRSGSCPLLITTDDIFATGLDITNLQVSHVINFDLPTSPEKYLHRVGQCTWLKRKGFAINFMTLDDEKMISDIQSFYNVVIDELPQQVDDLIYHDTLNDMIW